MSHELRTPLNSVIALSGVLSRRLANKIGADEFSYLEVIERNGKHLLTLINDVLDISRIEAGREEVEISRFSSENLIADLIIMIQPQAHQKNIELIQKENKHNVFITSDIHKCRHIMQNLIANAVKFTEKGKVEIKVIQKTETIEISFSDTGIGIPPHHVAHIFDEFRQADSSTSRRYGGTGLGLAIAKKYANLLGGTISVTSTPEKGSVFTLTLPINYKEENRIIEEPAMHFEKPLIPTAQNINNNEKTVLIVDDSEPAIIQLKDFMIESGFKILTAYNGEDALHVISKIIPDAIILDLMMPGIDGFEVLKTIREAEPTAHIPVLILTAKHITKEDLKFLKRNNVHQLIQKGDVNRADLLQAITRLVFIEEMEPLKPKNSLQKISGKPNVLVVEDNPDNMTTVKAIFGNKFNVLEAINGLDGINQAIEHVPHLILMDIALPGIDGIEAFKTIRRNGNLEHIPIIALTASAMTLDRETILSHGFDAYIAKPIDEKKFFDIINKVLYGK
jgi:CheY-like chemotaxis protein/anti-sigma regulatory factor (Ser/Thr protein kinase)